MYCLKGSGVCEAYKQVLKDMYVDAMAFWVLYVGQFVYGP